MQGISVTIKLYKLLTDFNNYDINVIGFGIWLAKIYSTGHSW